MYMLSQSLSSLRTDSETTLVVTLMVLFLSAAIISLVVAARIGKTDSRNLVQCPFCAKLIKQEAITCQYCGQGLLAPSSQQQAAVIEKIESPRSVQTESLIVELPQQQPAPISQPDLQQSSAVAEESKIPQAPKKEPTKTSFARGVLGLVIVLLIASQFVLYSRVKSLEKKLDYATERLSYVTALAENADRYAHDHSYSDRRLKINIEPLSDPLERVLALQGVHFSWRSEEFRNLDLGNEPEIGFIAQDVQAVFPELVSIEPNGYLTVDYEKLTPILVEAIKEQQFLIENLQRRISDLEDSRQ